MNNKLAIILGVLFLFASLSAFNINVQGDMAVINNYQEAAAPGGLTVYPTTAPRYCDVKVASAPNVLVKVYAHNGVYTGLSCTTNAQGECTFKFNSNQARGTYTVSGNNQQASVVLEPSTACVSDIVSFTLSPPSMTRSAGVPGAFIVSAKDSSGRELNVTPIFTLDDPTIGAISVIGDYPKIGWFMGKKAGTTTVRAVYGTLVATSNVTVTPGVCNDIAFNTTFQEEYRAGTPLRVDSLVVDKYGNVKSGIEVTLTYTDANGTSVTNNTKTDARGIATITINVGPKAGTGHIVVEAEDSGLFCSAPTAEKDIRIVPREPYQVIVLPPSQTKDVHDTVKFTALAYDYYMNEIDDAKFKWSTDNTRVATVDEAGLATANLPGTATITASTPYHYYTMEERCISKLCWYEPVSHVGMRNGTAQLTVRTGAPANIVLTPVDATVVAGKTFQFTALVYDQYGVRISNPHLAWSASAGSIDANGLYTAPHEVGTAQVNVSYNNIVESATVHIVNDAPAYIHAYSEGPLASVNSPHILFANVTDQYGNAVNGATVVYTLLSGAVDPSTATVQTNTDGIATQTVTTGSVEEAIIYSMTVEGTSLSDTDSFRVVIPNATVSGMVSDSFGNPLENVQVVITGPGNVATPYSATTNANGTYTIVNVSLDGTYNVTASRDGYQPAMITREIHKNNNYNDFNFVLVQYARVYGRVTDSDNSSPVAGANVSVLDSGNVINHTLTDDNGNYSITIAPAPSGAYSLYVSAAGYDSETVGFSIQPGQSLRLDIQLGGFDNTPPQLSFVDPTPAGFSNVSGQITVATVAVDQHYNATVIFVNGAQAGSCATPACSVSIDTTTYADGALTVSADASDTRGLETMASRTFYVDNIPPAVSFVAPTPADGSSQEEPFVVNVSADDATGINRMAISINGTQVAECESSTTCSYVVNTSLYSGVINVSATAYSALTSATVSRTFNITGINPLLASLSLNATPSSVFVGEASTVRARLVDNNGQPLEGYTVAFSASGGAVVPASAQTNSNGEAVAAFSSDAPGTFQVNASVGQLYNSTTITVSIAPQNGTFTGAVRNASGDPLDGASVQLLKNNQALFTTLTNSTGGYSISVPADTYDVVVSHSGYLSVRDNVHIDEGQATTRDYILTKMSRLYGFVSNESGDAVGSAMLKAYRNGALVSTVQSQADGWYEFILASGVYTVEITHQDYLRSLYTVYVPPTSEVQKNVTMYR